MIKRDYPVSKIANGEWRDFALYTVEARAIPSAIDGMKPVQRFVLYSSLLNSKNTFEKVSAVSGVISKYGYNHAEQSAAGACQLMAATWNNNICLLEGQGSFGTRLVQEAGSPRYVYTRVHPNFYKYIKDIDLAPVHHDPEHEPPAYYIPIIPLVLVNGIRGIATGFATNILPRSPVAVANAVKEYLKTGKIEERIAIQFPEFSGTMSRDKDGKVHTVGTFRRRGKTVVEITEVPYGFDRKEYMAVLDQLEEKDLIGSYDNLCDKSGFRFDVKLKQASSNWTDAQIISNFKLSKSFPENLTVIDHNGKLREYADERELIKDFCDFRLTIMAKRIEARIKQYSEHSRWLRVRMAFVQAILDDKIVFKNRGKVDITEQIVSVVSQVVKLEGTDVERLLQSNIASLTKEMVATLAKEIAQSDTDLKFWQTTTPNAQFMLDLKEIS